jgi:multisubunit Na+/H+ antiporter MnhG subunit
MKEDCLKTILKCISWFLENLYAEFLDWAKFLILGIGGIFLAVLMWQVEGLMGKTLVIAILVFIVAGALVKTCSKISGR